MIGLDYLAAGLLHLAASDIKCQIKKTPAVTVTARNSNVRYDHSKSQAQLDDFEHDTVSPYDRSVQTHVGGLMSGEVSISQNLRMMQETWPHVNAGCLYVDTIKVTIDIKPTIYIANDFPKDGCMYRAIMEHEKKHIEVDRTIVAKYRPLITDAVHGALREMGDTRGPLSIRSLPAEQERMQAFVQGAVKRFSAQMSEERQRRQQEVDTLEEYERVQAKCRGRR